MTHPTIILLHEVPAEPMRARHTAADNAASFAEALQSAVPLFSTWNAPVTPAAPSSISPTASITTQSTSGRRHDGKRRSHS